MTLFVSMEERVYQSPLDTSAFATEDSQVQSVKVSQMTNMLSNILAQRVLYIVRQSN